MLTSEHATVLFNVRSYLYGSWQPRPRLMLEVCVCLSNWFPHICGAKKGCSPYLLRIAYERINSYQSYYLRAVVELEKVCVYKAFANLKILSGPPNEEGMQSILPVALISPISLTVHYVFHEDFSQLKYKPRLKANS